MAPRHVGDALHDAAGLFDLRAGGQFAVDDEDALVVVGREGGAYFAGHEHAEGEDAQRGRQRHGLVVHGRGDQAPVAALQRAQQRVAELRGAAGRRDAQDARADKGRQRQREDQRQRNGDDDGDAEGVKDAADDAAHRGDGREHADGGEGAAEHGETDFVRALEGRVEGQQSLVHVRVDVLQHDGGGVDDHADGQRDGHHRHVVDGDAQVRQHAETADQADGHGDDRHERGAERLQEKQHQQRAEDHGLDDVAADAVHGAADEVAGNKLFPVDVISSFKLVIGQNK